MVGKLLIFPFWIIKKILDTGFGFIRLGIGIIRGTFRFVFSRVVGTALGAVLGALLGKKHVGVK